MYNNLPPYATETSRQEPSASSASFLSGRGAPSPGPTLQMTASVSNCARLRAFRKPAKGNTDVPFNPTLPQNNVPAHVSLFNPYTIRVAFNPEHQELPSFPPFWPVWPLRPEQTVPLPYSRSETNGLSSSMNIQTSADQPRGNIPPREEESKEAHVRRIPEENFREVRLQECIQLEKEVKRANQLRTEFPKLPEESISAYICRIKKEYPNEKGCVIQRAVALCARMKSGKQSGLLVTSRKRSAPGE